MLCRKEAVHYPGCKDEGWMDWTPLPEIQQKFHGVTPLPISTHMMMRDIPDRVLNGCKVQ